MDQKLLRATAVRQAISFCFDDGFRRSAQVIAEQFSRRGLSACFAVLAQPEEALDPYLRGADLGGWAFWRDLAAAGHEVAPHGLRHERYDDMSLPDTQVSVLHALQIMEAELPGFERSRSVFHVPYASAPPTTVDWLATQSLGVRLTRKGHGLNRWADLHPGGLVNSICFGPDEVDAAALARLRDFKADGDGWLVLALHGVDGEGWGPVSRHALERLIDEALAMGAEVVPPNRLLETTLGRC